MATLLFNLRHVPDDEAEEVRTLLEDNGIDFYETSAGSWRTSVPALWVRDEAQVGMARELLERYQEQRRERARAEYEAQKQAGEHATFWRNFRERPVRVAASLGLVVLVMYLSVRLFVSMD